MGLIPFFFFVTFHSGKEGEYGKWPGSLPHGLDFADSTHAVERKLGQPDQIVDLESSGNMEYSYRTTGVVVRFARAGKTVPHHIV